jgi:hypothetical protein
MRRLGEVLMACGERCHEIGTNGHRDVVAAARVFEQRHTALVAHDRGDHIEVVGCAGRVLRFTR